MDNQNPKVLKPGTASLLRNHPPKWPDLLCLGSDYLVPQVVPGVNVG